MYEPYLNREKQYVKMNAELDNRFKEIDQIKSDRSEIVKPRLNVFGNGSKVNINQSVRSVVHTASKPKRNEINCGTASGTSGTQDLNSKKNVISDVASSVDRPQMLKTCSSKDHSMSKIKLSDNDSSAAANRNQVQTAVMTNKNSNNNGAVTNDATVKKNISSDGLIK